MNKIIKRYSFEGKEYILVKGFDLEAFEVKPVDMEFFKEIENHVKEIKAKELLYSFVEKVNDFSITDLGELEYFLDRIPKTDFETIEKAKKLFGM